MYSRGTVRVCDHAAPPPALPPAPAGAARRLALLDARRMAATYVGAPPREARGRKLDRAGAGDGDDGDDVSDLGPRPCTRDSQGTAAHSQAICFYAATP